MSETAPARGLSIHARYECRHSGACCTAGWEIPVERRLDRELRTAAAAGRLMWAAEAPLIVDRTGLPVEFASVLGRRQDGACVLHDEATRRCTAHARLGASSKPVACRQFPRIVVHDPRGTSVSLSHFCPTAAGLLFDDEAVLTVRLVDRTNPGAHEGLDVRLSLPPALDAGRLVDWDTLTAWEALVLEVCNRVATPSQLLGVLHAARAHLQAWSSRRGPMRDWLLLFDPARVDRSGPGVATRAWESVVRSAIPEPLRPPAGPEPDGAVWAELGQPRWPLAARPLCRYLAARAFACWPLHVGQGLVTQLRYLEAALCLVERAATREVARRSVALDAAMLKEAIRQTDLLLVHLADPRQLADALDAAD